jgi:hypothetical protein
MSEAEREREFQKGHSYGRVTSAEAAAMTQRQRVWLVRRMIREVERRRRQIAPSC